MEVMFQFFRKHRQYHLRPILIAVRLCNAPTSSQSCGESGGYCLSSAAAQVRPETRQLEQSRSRFMCKSWMVI